MTLRDRLRVRAPTYAPTDRTAVVQKSTRCSGGECRDGLVGVRDQGLGLRSRLRLGLGQEEEEAGARCTAGDEEGSTVARIISNSPAAHPPSPPPPPKAMLEERRPEFG